uniref:Uncharacterized protein n=1 Tax=Nelumbo nucifera TaxID=4432 RepID=A0A822ZCB9_NELNU|nr:TPA_asm: hypothetical protein HUJ06_002088 [Nelumbo nucifera]DAD43864.1 TPA_asm: hypothetical protein HUJ06_002094 [Nelumbo nucifera]DAD44133.1 TPA_asm: hypothetical protein HUJ06_002363 [Nelumbo nucifera]
MGSVLFGYLKSSLCKSREITSEELQGPRC